MFDDFALFRFAWDDGFALNRYFTNVQPQFGFALILVRAMARVTAF